MAEIYSQTLLITLIQQGISVIGIIFNLAIVWITARNKSLQNSYGYFLAIYSFSEALLEADTFLPTILVLNNIKISLLSCYYASVIQATWAGSNASFNMLFISVDRLLAMSFPVFYQFVLKNGAGKFAILLNCISSAYIFVLMYFDYFYVLENSNSTVYCEPGEQMGGEMLSWALYNLIVLNIVTLSIYIILGIVIKCSHGTNNQSHVQTRRIYKSIAVIMSIIFLCYFLAVFCYQYIPLIINDPQLSFLYIRLFAQLTTVAGAINAPVLYCLSTEYRNALNQHFPFIHNFLTLCHIHANSNIVLPAMVISNNPILVRSMATLSLQNQMPPTNMPPGN